MIKEDMNMDEHQYEKFEKRGSESLTDAELLAIILRSGSKDASALKIAKNILSLCGQAKGLAGLYHVSLRELMAIRGIGRVNAV